MSLCELAEIYGSDKCPKINHNYTPAYHTILSNHRDRIKTMIEIGVGNPELMSPIVGESYKAGASLRMWRDYFKNAFIYGCDIREDVLFEEDRIKCLYLDQSSPKSLSNLCVSMMEKHGAIDIILDDGSHIPEHQKISFEYLWNLVKPGGFYIIEDIFVDMCEITKLPEVLQFTDCRLVYVHKCNKIGGFVCFKKLDDE